MAEEHIPKLKHWILGSLALLVLTGCTSVSPTRVTADRMEYSEVIAGSWKRQLLVNVVRLRYADAPVFLEVASIINSYTVGGGTSALATLPSGPDPRVMELGATGNWSNTPTVTYQPLTGDQFTKSLLRPIPPVAVFQLLQGGWPVDLVFPTVVGSINELRNASAGIAADPRFDELIQVMSRVQRSGNIGIRFEEGKEGGGVVAVIRRAESGTELSEDSRRVRELLKLEADATEFAVNYGMVPGGRNEVAMLSRSMMEILLQLGFGIDLPAEHASSGRAVPGRWQPGDARARPLVHIHSGKEAPSDAYSAVSYKGYWYWIDDSDIASKRTFTFLMILFSLAETGQPTVAPVVTVPAR